MMQMIRSSLERINDKLDKHDDKFDFMSESLRQLIKIDTETRENRESIGRAFKKIDALDLAQEEIKREIERKHAAHIIEVINHNEKVEARVKNLEDKPLTRMEFITKAFLGALGVGVYTWVISHFKL